MSAAQIELSCVYCGRECWHHTKHPTIDFLERVAAARGWQRREGLSVQDFGREPHWACDVCLHMEAQMQKAQD